MMMQQPPTGGGGGAVHPSMDQQQQHQPQQQYSASPQPQPQPTTSTARTLWIGDSQNWMDKVEEKEVRTLWIGDLQHWMDEDYIYRCFAHTGEVFTSKVIRNKKTTGGKSECYGFIEFKSRAIAERFLHRFNGTPMPRVAGSNFSLNWASSSFGLGGEEEDDCADFTISVGDDDLASDIVTGMNSMFCSTIPNTVGGDAPQFPKEMFNQRSKFIWEDILKWWTIAQGTRTAHAVHAAHRVYAIGTFLKIHYTEKEKKGVTPADIEELLDELRGYANSIDIAKELHSIGSLDPLLGNLYSKHASIRAKAAKVISAMVQNNLSSQQLVMEAGGEQLLFYVLLSDRNATVVTNTLDAIASLFRNNIPGITAFRKKGGYEGMLYGLDTMCVSSQWKTLNLIRCLVQEHNSDCKIVTELGFPRIMMQLAFSDHAEVREATLKCLLVLARVEEGGNRGQLVKNDHLLKLVLQELIEGISAMDPEDLAAAREERQLVDSLWNACYNEPSSLRERGLLVLPGEDAPHRVYAIGAFLKIHPIELEKKGVTPAEIEESLDELRGYVDSIDVAKELHSIGSLDALLGYLYNTHAGIRAKAAKVISTMVQNNPSSQKLVVEAGGEQLLFYTFFSDRNATVVNNALDAISSLFRNNIPGIAAFRQKNGYADLIYGLDTVCVNSQRKTLNLIRCLVQEHNSDCKIVSELGFPRIMMHLASSDHAEVREAALECLLVLARVEEGENSAQLVKNDDKLKQVLQELIEGISAMAPDDLGAAREERQLVDSLWNACYNEPSYLREKGLLVLPGEDAPAQAIFSSRQGSACVTC